MLSLPTDPASPLRAGTATGIRVSAGTAAEVPGVPEPVEGFPQGLLALGARDPG
jgi:hypothetical protein